MAEYLSSPVDDNDPASGFSPNGEPVREWFRRVTPQTCDGSFSSSILSLSSNSSGSGSEPLNDSEREVMDMTIRTAQDCILQLKAMLNRQNTDVRKLRKESICENHQWVQENSRWFSSSMCPNRHLLWISRQSLTWLHPLEHCQFKRNVQELYAGQRFHPQGHANTKSTRRERKRERSLNSSCEIFSPPAKRPIKERLGLRSGAEEPPTPVNSSTEKSRDLSTKFVAQNPSAKEVEEIPIVDVSSYSSSGVASNLSGSSRSPPSETPKLSPIVTQSHPSGPPPCRALLLDFEKPRPLMSINAPPL